MRVDWRKLWDTTIVVALIGVIGGGTTSAISGLYDRNDRQQDRAASRRADQCRNAFAFLADETPNPDLTVGQRKALAKAQFDRAIACGR